jgi:hypothetical protein
MTTIAQICEKWTMTLEPPQEGDETWFADWVLRSPKEAGKHLTAGFRAMASLRALYEPSDMQTCREYFGGMGAQALMAEELFGPFDTDTHTVMDYSAAAVEHMRRALRNEHDATIAMVKQADSYDPSSCVPADLVLLDFGDLTVWKTRDGEPHRKLLDRVFAHRPKAVLLTDIACRYLHLHRERYETLLGPGSCQSYETYLDAFVGRIEELYGYTLYWGNGDRWSTVMALVPEVLTHRGTVQPTADSPVGLELI